MIKGNSKFKSRNLAGKFTSGGGSNLHNNNKLLNRKQYLNFSDLPVPRKISPSVIYLRLASHCTYSECTTGIFREISTCTMIQKSQRREIINEYLGNFKESRKDGFLGGEATCIESHGILCGKFFVQNNRGTAAKQTRE